jgi:twitching motility protein PilU
LKCFVSQRLVPTDEGKRAAATEILLVTPTVAQAIHEGEIETIKEIMSKSENTGMPTFESALFKIYESGKISFEDALKNADSAYNLRLQIKLLSSHGIPEGSAEEMEKQEHFFLSILKKMKTASHTKQLSLQSRKAAKQ